MLASVRKEGVSFLREYFGEVILVISGRAAGCTKALGQRSEGAIFSKRSKPQGTDSSPHDASTIIAGGLMSIQGDAALFHWHPKQ